MATLVRSGAVRNDVLARIIRAGAVKEEHLGAESTITELRRAGLLDEMWDLTLDLYEYALAQGVLVAEGVFRLESGMRVWFDVTGIQARGPVCGEAAKRVQYALAGLISQGRASVEPVGLGQYYRVSC